MIISIGCRHHLWRVTFGACAITWYVRQDLAASTTQNYRRHIEEHLLPTFEEFAVADIREMDFTAWEKAEPVAGHAESSIRTWRATLHRFPVQGPDVAVAAVGRRATPTRL